VAGAVLVMLGSGCATTTHEQMVTFLREHEAETSAGQYLVHPPDVIAIHAPGITEVDGSMQELRSDGRIVLRLLGEIDVAGLTTEEIGGKIETQLARYYRNPEVVVQVARFNSQFYYVFGEVAGPGPRPLTGRVTVLQALAEATPTFLAWRSQVRVTRPGIGEEEPKTIVVDLDHMIRSGDLTQNILLQPGDIIEVPPTPLGWFGHRVRELLYPFDPMFRLYNLPAQAIHSTRIYEDEWGSSSDTDSNSRRLLYD
jgi:polysaccharide export outer membrane protein